MKRFLVLTAGMALAGLTSMVAASDNINAIVKAIASGNPTIAISKAKTEAEKAQLKTENVLPDPEIEVSHLWGSKQVGNKWDLGVSQSFDWPGVYRARSRENTAMAGALEQLDAANNIETMLNIRQTLIDYINASRREALYSSVLDNVDSLLMIYNKGYDNGEISILEVNKLKIERIGTSRKYNEEAQSRSSLADKLKQLAGGADVEPLLASLDSFPNPELRPLDYYLHRASTVNPALSYNRSMMAVMDRKDEVAKRSRIPGFTIGYQFENEMGDKFNGFSVGLTLPVFSTRKQRAAIALQRNAYELESRAVEDATSLEIASAHSQATKILDEINQYKPLIESTDNLALLKKAKEHEHISLTEYFTELNFFLEANIDYNDLYYRYNLLMAQLEKFEQPVE